MLSSSLQNTSQYSAPRLHLAFLDGIRGVTALYVALFHCQMVLDFRVGTPPGLFFVALRWLLGCGYFAVGVFIVLSGYVLTLPIARSENKQLRGGLKQFISRRARRVLPAYYAALLLFSGLVLASRVAHIPNDFNDQLTTRSFTEHLLLGHNWTDSIFLIDPQMWSLAMEWQIYFVFALALLPLYRRIGIGTTIAIAFAVSLALGLALPKHLGPTAPWYVGLFSLGMLGAHWQFDTTPLSIRMRSVHWGWVALICGLTVLIAHSAVTDARSLPSTPLTALLYIVIGIGALGLIMQGTRDTNAGRQSLIRSFWESRAMLGLGLFSYSLYLFHMPLLDYSVQVLRHLHLPLTVVWFVTFGLLPLVVRACSGCYLLFERPFMVKSA